MESNAWCPRLTAAMILSGSAVHVKGFGSALVSARKRLMADWRSTTGRKTPRFKRRLDSLAKKPSTALSQEHSSFGVPFIRRCERRLHPVQVDAWVLTTDLEI